MASDPATRDEIRLAITDSVRAAERDGERIDRMVNKLRAAWHMHPDLRLGQLVTNLAESVTFYAEDDQVEAALDAVIAGRWSR